MKGLFITFEGPDGSGKTTQLKLLADYLIKAGYEVITTREPGGTIIGNQIREILLNPNHKELMDQTEILLYAASRAQLVHETILPNLEKGKIILSDRYIDASIAYQAYGLMIERNIVEQINSFASSNLIPDRTYLMKISPEIGQKRLKSRYNRINGLGLDRIEQKNLDYHYRVLEGFSILAKENPNRILTLEATDSIDSIFDIIKQDIKFLIRKEG